MFRIAATTLEDVQLELDEDRLAPDPDLALARTILASYEPTDDARRRERDRIVAWIDRHPTAAHRRSCLEGHLTASALVVRPPTTASFDGARVLLLHHRKLGKWIQPGGHCDGDANLPGVALRECVEETGIDGLAVVPEVIDVDVHTIPAHPGVPERGLATVPEHLHFDTRFLVVAPPGAEPNGNDESHDVRWLSIDDALERAGDESVRRMIRGWIARIRGSRVRESFAERLSPKPDAADSSAKEPDRDLPTSPDQLGHRPGRDSRRV